VFRGNQVPTASVGDIPADGFLLDVREKDEWAAGHAPDAVHVPMMEIPVRTDEVPTDRDVYVICRAGSRSAQVVAYLQQNGYDRVVNVEGGMQSWDSAAKPMVSENGGAAHVA
jgi:rhodanese-related sulfurtransferase